jgi:hypothetical protein
LPFPFCSSSPSRQISHYNIAVHELGHNIEQPFSLYDIDHTLLAGVPNTAFTDALARLFQARGRELLGRKVSANAP